VRIAAVVVAAGRGTRARLAGTAAKQYVPLGGVPVLRRTLQALSEVEAIALLQVVIHADDLTDYEQAIAGLDGPLLPPALGGPTRQASVLAGLEALAAHGPDAVLIHDAARPFVDASLVSRVILALQKHDGAIPALAVADTLKRADASGSVAATVPRAGLWRAQTPQGFHFSGILAAHRAVAAAGDHDLTDDAAVAERAGMTVALVEGSVRNVKLTTLEDFMVAERDLNGSLVPDVRTGTGFDVHRFADGDHVWLGGVRIAHTHRLEGHSDADVALHAITDAILGAIGDGDIGQHFPPSDPRWKGADSRIFLEDAARRVRALGGRIGNVDLTILCEAILGIEIGRIGVKATTTEGLGFTGRREGIAAMATATVVLP
jgi:2-C-methyl-D-erythritol 4-phosphate cytidylyltransferase / 2-C-methyl-D-erythritol 2,4-cyclodiphosphate synthase